MSLSTKAIDRIFRRLGATYGIAWDRSLGTTPISDAKSAWAHELQGFDGQIEAVAWALENLPERCPNVIEFRNLCRRAPAPVQPQLPEPKASPERLAAELSKLQQIRAMAVSTTPAGSKDWARRIIARHQAGEQVRPVSLRFAREALNMVAAV